MLFQEFQRYVQNLGGVWSGKTNVLVFSYNHGNYIAQYRPNYPNYSAEDSAIIYYPTTGMFEYKGVHTQEFQ